MKKKVIVAPLNWGLGHASRCVPIINALQENNYVPIIASDGNALTFLQKEFSELEVLRLPSYNISYGKNLKLGLLLQSPKILKALKEEKKVIEGFITKNKEVVGVISDNRFGARSSILPSVYITHQINVLSGTTTSITSKIHQKIIKKFDECWVPDNANSEFSGKLSKSNKNLNQKNIGVLSRFKKNKAKKTIDVLAILSGPEPNRSFLEKKLIEAFLMFDKKVVLVKGKVENQQKESVLKNITIYNFMLSDELEKTIQKAKLVISRSGYTSIMDLAILEKKVYFVPTKNQSEQEYLANYLEEKKIAPFCKEEDFTLNNLLEIDNYSGLKSEETQLNSELFCLFEGKRKL